jgi:DnaJ-class molecular chaperone
VRSDPAGADQKPVAGLGRRRTAGAAAAGDLYVIVNVGRTPGSTARPHVPHRGLGYAQMALGAGVTVETLHGPEGLTIPAGTKPGQQFS